MQRIAYASIDLKALRHNFLQVKQYAPNSKLICVIKANAYGHGMLEVAKALQDADGFAVACVDEALLLRKENVTQPITVFQGFQDIAELQACSQYQLWPVVHHTKQLELLHQAELAQPIDIWLKLSTGMNRLGFNPDDAHDVWRQLDSCSGVRNIRLMTHMARADEGILSEADFTEKQIQLFTASTSGIRAECSLANSATLIGWPAAHREWVRPGIMLYGASPFLPGASGFQSPDLQPVMQLNSRLIAINRRSKGDPIGYGSTWVCPENMPIGVVAIGYGDGYPRHIQAGTTLLIRGQSAKIVGRVSMDLLTVDLSGIDAAVGDEVVLWGTGLPVDRIAQQAGTISYELLCGIFGRVRYKYIN